MSNSKEVVLYTEQYKLWFRPMLIVVFPIMPLFWKYRVKITGEELSFGYSSKITTKRADRIFIKEVVPLFDQKWAGWEIRYNPPWEKAYGRWERQYIAKNGGAVKVMLGEAGSDKTTTSFFLQRTPKKFVTFSTKSQNKIKTTDISTSSSTD
jgi:hypothetical protein